MILCINAQGRFLRGLGPRLQMKLMVIPVGRSLVFSGSKIFRTLPQAAWFFPDQRPAKLRAYIIYQATGFLRLRCKALKPTSDSRLQDFLGTLQSLTQSFEPTSYTRLQDFLDCAAKL